MKSIIVGVFAVGVLYVTGCSTYFSDASKTPNHSSYGVQKTTKTAAQPASTINSSILTLPAFVPASTTTSPASPPNLSIASTTVPTTTVVITNIVTITNRTEIAPFSEVEFTNGIQRRAHFRFKDKTTEEAFLQIVAKKQSTLEDVRVIGKLYQQKNVQQQQFTASLQDQFAIKSDRSYQYDAEAMTINEVVKPAAGNESAKTQLHMKLKDAATAQTFARLVTAKRVSVEEMAGLQLMYREKQMEIAEYDRQLSVAYAIVKDRSYQYDSTTRTLFELIKLPQGVESTAAGKVVPVK